MILLSLDRSDTSRPLLQCFGFFIPFGRSIQFRQAIKARGYFGMVPPQRFLENCQRAFVEWLGGKADSQMNGWHYRWKSPAASGW